MLIREDATDVHVCTIPKPLGIIRLRRKDYQAYAGKLRNDITIAMLKMERERASLLTSMLENYLETGNTWLKAGQATLQIIEEKS